MAHAALGGGKRLRPFLVLEVAAMGGAPEGAALPAALAIEMVHCYSLVHDDLPAMDNADTRRGQPSVHRAYDEATAILVGDGLLTDAFGLLASGAYPPPVAAALVAALARGAGSAGMVGGQMLDLAPDGHADADIRAIQAMKTGALIEAAAEMGAIIAGLADDRRAAVIAYARQIGLAFQIVDDVLDATGSAETLGKPAGADAAAGKATFVSLLGLEGARAEIARLTDAATASLSPFGPRAASLSLLATMLAARTQ
jgi:farnesyl diphosphate synthase